MQWRGRGIWHVHLLKESARILRHVYRMYLQMYIQLTMYIVFLMAAMVDMQ